jgi:hypothetical protein
MTEVILGLGVVALIGAAVIHWSWKLRRGSASSATTSTRAPADPWLAQAAELAQTGRQLLEQIEPIVETNSGLRSGESATGLPTRQLDDFTRSLAELAATAPTSMDNRVCRSVAVQSRGLSDALRARSCGSDNASPNADRARVSDLHDRFSEFSLALTDLEQHIHLI